MTSPKLPLLIIATTLTALILSGCTVNTDTSKISEAIVQQIDKAFWERANVICQDKIDFMRVRTDIQLLGKEGYQWEQDGIKFTAKAVDACVQPWLGAFNDVPMELRDEVKNMKACKD